MKPSLKMSIITGMTLCLGAISYFLVTKSADPYFAPLETRQLTTDEKGQWQYVRSLYKKMDATGQTFKNWDHNQKDMWKYAIAFLSYGMPSLAMIKPDWRPEITYYMSIMIDKMKSQKVWGDWQEYGFGEDPICLHNIMYKGHLNLMYGLYELHSGDQRYAHEFRWLTEKIVDEINDSQSKGFQGVVCEPNQYFVHCNAIGLLSLHIYDKIYGTNYTENQVKPTLTYMNQNLRDPISGLYWESFHPSHNTPIRELSGYTNAWALALLKHFDPEFYGNLYQRWKETFVTTRGPFAYVKETTFGGPSRIATLFGILTAKEFEDQELFAKLITTVDLFGYLHSNLETGQMSYAFADNTLLNGMILSFKLHQGFTSIINHPWQKIPKPPLTKFSKLRWQDILHQSQY